MILIASLILAFSARAQNVDPNAKNCTAMTLCPQIEKTYKSCTAKKPTQCEEYVSLFRKLLAKGDCVPEIDTRTGAESGPVSAITLCDAHQDFTMDLYLRRLATLKSPDARALFTSPGLRELLVGPLKESYLKLSIEAERKKK